jgi:D-alanine--poly(phosphoribitol) ligase subunit 1
MVCSFVACIYSGHPYVPVDNATPRARAKQIVDASGCCAIIAAEPWPVPGEATPILDAAGQWYPALAEDGSASSISAIPISGNDTFYIIFTSGTTGAPKGVQISHDNLFGFTDWILRDFDLRPGMRFLLQAAFSFDLSVMSLWPALLSGGTLVTISKVATTDFKRLFTEMPKLNLNVWVSTPSFADLCLSDPIFNEALSPNLSHFLFCGDELLNRTADKLIDRFPAARVFNTYGPTEATVAVTQVEITKDITAANDRLPVGSVRPDTFISILDEQGAKVPDGVIGEIIIYGSPISKGYLNDPVRTAESFFEFEGLPAYRSGDAGLLLDGQLFFKGRLDFQVKFHGYRIELEDIEQHLLKSPFVADAIVVPEYKDYKVRRLVAYVVTAPGAEAQSPGADAEPMPLKDYEISKAIKVGLTGEIMQYMIPQKFVYKDSLPLTKNGKTDRKQILNEVNGL